MKLIVYFYVSDDENENYADKSGFFYRYLRDYWVIFNSNLKYQENILGINMPYYKVMDALSR